MEAQVVTDFEQELSEVSGYLRQRLALATAAGNGRVQVMQATNGGETITLWELMTRLQEAEERGHKLEAALRMVVGVYHRRHLGPIQICQERPCRLAREVLGDG